MWGEANSSNQQMNVYIENTESHLWRPAPYNLAVVVYFRNPITMNGILSYWYRYFNQEKQNLMAAWDP